MLRAENPKAPAGPVTLSRLLSPGPQPLIRKGGRCHIAQRVVSGQAHGKVGNATCHQEKWQSLPPDATAHPNNEKKGSFISAGEDMWTSEHVPPSRMPETDRVCREGGGGARAGGLGPAPAHSHICKGCSMGACCIAQGTLPSALGRSMWEEHLKKSGRVDASN